MLYPNDRIITTARIPPRFFFCICCATRLYCAKRRRSCFCDTQKRQYRKQGFFIVDDAVDPDMLNPLLEAAIRAKQKVRSGEVDLYTHRSEDGEPWAIRGLFAPEMNEPIFAEYLMSEPIMKYTHAFLGTQFAVGRHAHLHKSISGGLRFWLAPGFWQQGTRRIVSGGNGNFESSPTRFAVAPRLGR